MADYLPRFKPGQTVTHTASADITGGQLVEITGARRVAPAAAASTKTVGVAGFDVKSGGEVTVHSGGVQRCLASAAIAAGDVVQAAAAGKVAAGTVAPIGIALTAATAADQLVEIQLNR